MARCSYVATYAFYFINNGFAIRGFHPIGGEYLASYSSYSIMSASSYILHGTEYQNLVIVHILLSAY